MSVSSIIQILLLSKMFINQCIENGVHIVITPEDEVFNFSFGGTIIGVHEDTLKVDYLSGISKDILMTAAPGGGFYLQHATTQLYFDAGSSNQVSLVVAPTEKSRIDIPICQTSGIRVFRFVATQTVITSTNLNTAIHVQMSQVTTKAKMLFSNKSQTYNLTNCVVYGVNLCYRCKPGYIRPSNVCVAGTCNIPDCALCNATNLCKYCRTGNPPNSKGTCLCSYISHCATCDTSWKCLTCDPGYILNGTVCESCDDANCHTCSPKSTCKLCSSQFVLINDMCVRKAKANFVDMCIDLQAQCWKIEIDDLSKGAYFFSFCPQSDCNQCVNNHICSTCILSSQLISIICPLPIFRANSSYEVDLISSTALRYEDYSCWDPDCNLCDSENFCNSCKNGLKTLMGVCVPDNNDYSDTNCTNCVYCQRFRAVVSSSVCDYTSCSVVACSNCANGIKCIECKNGFILTRSGCEKLPDVTCDYGYYESERTCKVCSTNFENCKSCSSAECLECSNGYILSNGICGIENCSISNCQSCIDRKCETCQENFVLVDGQCVGKTSIECDQESCIFCPTKTICERCSEEYELFNQRCSTPCQIDNCKKCLDNKCLECFDSFTLENNSCTKFKCSVLSCVDCPNPKICSVCKEDWSLFNGGCYLQNCTSPCVLCNLDGDCFKYDSTVSDDGFSLPPCEIQDCALCDLRGMCVVCSYGFQLDVHNHCSETFQSCKPGTVFNGVECQACGFGCEKCQSVNLCLECLSSLTLEDGKCSKNEVEEVQESSPSQTMCLSKECILDGARLSSQCDNCQKTCTLKFAQISNMVYLLESYNVTFRPSTQYQLGRDIIVDLNFVMITFKMEISGIKLWTLSDSLVSKAYCNLKKNEIFSFVLGKRDSTQVESQKQQLTMTAVMGIIGFISGFFPAILSMLQMNNFFNLYYIVDPNPSYIFELANKATTTLFYFPSILKYKKEHYYTILMMFENHAIVYFLSSEKELLALIGTLLIIILKIQNFTCDFMKYSMNFEFKFSRIKKKSKKIIRIADSLILALAIPILSEIIYVVHLAFIESWSLYPYQVARTGILTTSFICMLMKFIRHLRKRFKIVSYLKKHPIKILLKPLSISKTIPSSPIKHLKRF